MAARPAVFLDRDGVITENVFYEEWGETEAPMRPEDAVIIGGALEAMRRLERAGFALFIVSNQGAFAKGKASLESLCRVREKVSSAILSAGVTVTEEYYSFTHPDGVADFFSGPSLERKPNPYFLKLAEARYGLDMAGSWMVGDRCSDVECGRHAGCMTVLLTDESPFLPEAGMFARDLAEASSLIIGKN
jgi:D-glycero-D-manno-heptose 1,7-bisphosphate phosphatase